jgi:hypothetical protein
MYIAWDSIFKNQKSGHMTTFYVVGGGELEENNNVTSYGMEYKR